MMTARLYDKIQFPADAPARLRTPSGRELTLTPFTVTDIEFSYDEMGYESVSRKGAYQAVRFFPDEPGAYTLTRDGVTQTILVTRGKHPGFVEISREDPRYFAYSDGSPCVPLGINLCFPTAFPAAGGFRYFGMRQYERWFRECAKNGVTMARIWLGHEYFCPDTLEAGVTDDVQMAKIDALMDLARHYGLRLKLVLEQFRYFDYSRASNSDSYEDDVFRKFNKNLYKNGRRCESSAEWMSDPLWQDAWLQKLAALALRLSGDPTVFGIELWNEMNCMPREHLNDWNRKMLPAVKALFPRHLVLNSLGSLDGDRVIDLYHDFCWELSDIKEIHRYLDRGAKLEVCHDSLIDLTRDGLSLIAEPQKPTLLSESGAVNNCHSGPFPHYLADHRGLLFCDSVYPALFLGSADCGHIWHWDGRYVESKNLYHLYRPLRELCRGVAFDRENFRPEVVEDEDTVLLLLRGKTTTLGYLRNKSECWQNRLRDQKESTPITHKSIPLTVSGAPKIIKIHPNRTDRLSHDGHTLVIHRLTFGVLLKWNQVPDRGL